MLGIVLNRVPRTSGRGAAERPVGAPLNAARSKTDAVAASVEQLDETSANPGGR